MFGFLNNSIWDLPLHVCVVHFGHFFVEDLFENEPDIRW